MSSQTLANKTQTIAAYSLIRALYDEEQDIYSVLRAMLLSVIRSTKRQKFSTQDLAQLINEIYEMEIPSSVIKTAMSNIHPNIEKDSGKYNIIGVLGDDGKFDEQYSVMHTSIQKVFKELNSFIENKMNQELTDQDRSCIEKSLFGFLMENPLNNQFSGHIADFVIRNKESDLLNHAREGIILFQGLKETKGSPTQNPFRPLTIYFGMDVLFDIGDLNDSVFGDAAKQLLAYIAEINRREKIILLKYFKSTKVRIDYYFNGIEQDYRNNQLFRRNDTATDKILSGVKSASDIKAKKSDFLNLLKSHHIEEENDPNFDDSNNRYYNELSGEFIETLIQKDKDENNKEIILRITEDLNSVNILRRGGSEKDILLGKTLFLTRQRLAKDISDYFQTEGKCHTALVGSVDYMVSLLWYKLNKGFGANMYPSCLSVFTSAQVLLASLTKKRILKEYQLVQDKFNSGELTQEKAVDRIYELKTARIEPSDINIDSVDSITSMISDAGFQDYTTRIEKVNEELTYSEDERKKLAIELEKSLKSQAKSKKENEEYQASLNSILHQRLSELEEKNNILSQKVNRSERRAKVVVFCIRLIVALALFFCLNLFSSIVIPSGNKNLLGIDFINQYAVLTSIILTILTWVFPTLKEFWRKINRKFLDWIPLFITKVFKHNFFVKELEECNEEILTIQNQIEKLQGN